MKMIRVKYPKLGLMCLLFSCCLNAQLVNSSEITVLPGTVMSVFGPMVNTLDGTWINNGDLQLHSNVTNHGHFHYDGQTSDFGVVRFLGPNSQVVNGDSFLWLWDVFFDTGGVLLQNGLSISGACDFVRGIIENRTNGGDMIFEGESLYGNVSDISHVDGPVIKNGNQNFLFPTGHRGIFRGLGVEQIQDSNHAFNSLYINGNSDDSFSHGLKEEQILYIDTREYWSIERLQGSTNAVITIHLDPQTSDPVIFNEPIENLSIVRWDPSARLWVVEPSMMDEANASVTSVAAVGSDGIVALAILELNSELSQGFQIYNAISPNGDGKNDVLFIEGVEAFEQTNLKIYNRWGVLVFEVDDYNNEDRAFKGFSEGRITIRKKELLPTGTYFYVFTYHEGSTVRNKAGYLYINEEN